MAGEIKFDALLPREMAEKAEMIGVTKANLPFLPLLVLAILAGAYISLGAMFATITYSVLLPLSFGVARLMMGLAFCLGLILVVVSGSELFTGNSLVFIAWASRKVSTIALLRNWGIVYLGNFIGSLCTAALVFLSGQYNFNDGAVGEVALKIALNKSNLGFTQALALGILCNALVCLAVWMTYSGRSTTDKIVAIVFPITAFVVAGFEHSVANMYFIPYGLMIKTFDPAFAAIHEIDLINLSWNVFMINNLLPVTLGNIIGGAGLVGGMYWFIYLFQAGKSTNATNPNLPKQERQNTTSNLERLRTL